MARANKEHIRLTVFMAAANGYNGYHVAGWRHPGAFPNIGGDISLLVQVAKKLEQAKFDALFFADSISTAGTERIDSFSHSSRASHLEPLTTLGALAMVTNQLGLVATASTTYHEPYMVARMFASLDHLSGGRVGWNIVTGGNPEDALNVGNGVHPPHAERYQQAEEFVDVVRGLWDSFDDDAFVRDKQTGLYLDPDKFKPLLHEGHYYKVKGPLSVARPPQGHPLLVQAGGSEPAMAMAARVADVMFSAQHNLDEAKEFYRDVKGRLQAYGREPESLKILPGIVVCVGATEDEAEEKFQRLQSLIPDAVAFELLRAMLGGVDLSGCPLDGPVPDLAGNDVRVSGPESLMRVARKDGLTVRQLAHRVAAGKNHLMIKGTPDRVADILEQWFEERGADGFNLMPSYFPGDLDDFIDLVIPELRRRNLVRREYDGQTLRGLIGVDRPRRALPAEQIAR